MRESLAPRSPQRGGRHRAGIALEAEPQRRGFREARGLAQKSPQSGGRFLAGIAVGERDGRLRAETALEGARCLGFLGGTRGGRDEGQNTSAYLRMATSAVASLQFFDLLYVRNGRWEKCRRLPVSYDV